MNGAAMPLPQSVVKAINEPLAVPEKRPEQIAAWRERHASLVAGTEP